MASLEGFDANKVEPNTVFDAIPAGDYPVIIADSKMRDTKDGKGKMLELKLQIVQQGKYMNRTLFDRLNLKNANEQAVQIAQGTLSAICRAVNVLTPKDSAELHNKPLVATVKLGEYNGNPKNEIKGYKPLDKKTAAKPKNMIEEAFEDAGEVVTASEKKSPWS